ncbi:MAG: FAD-linked oxidase C-terminal domain-containing protein, partial [Pseudomonadota bacterium]
KIVYAITAELGGSISAEHGIGQSKRDALKTVKPRETMAAMRVVKQALDPKGIMNPGKIL